VTLKYTNSVQQNEHTVVQSAFNNHLSYDVPATCSGLQLQY